MAASREVEEITKSKTEKSTILLKVTVSIPNKLRMKFIGEECRKVGSVLSTPRSLVKLGGAIVERVESRE
ncbi:hypothetical protein AGMMS49938_16290 [Fibrobacterales bacterium]|nr:hypothetical protein AGMMS49938_16290 [Fibrobacterales bacterium]